MRGIRGAVFPGVVARDGVTDTTPGRDVHMLLGRMALANHADEDNRAARIAGRY
jgi:hypothetical protein